MQLALHKIAPAFGNGHDDGVLVISRIYSHVRVCARVRLRRLRNGVRQPIRIYAIKASRACMQFSR